MLGPTVKQRAMKALRTLRDDAIARLCLIAKIEEGLQQSDAARLTDHDEVKTRILLR